MTTGLPTPIAHYPSIATIGAVEDAIRPYTYTNVYQYPLTLDMSHCEYMEVTTLVYTVAMIADRCAKSLQTYVVLPERNVLDFIRIWRFPQAIQDATGRDFSHFLSEGDKTAFTEANKAEPTRYAGNVLDNNTERLLSDKYFALYTFSIDRDQPYHGLVPDREQRLVEDHAKHWQESLILTVLQQHLKERPGYIGSRVVYEALMNALRHPMAKIIQTASHFDRPHQAWKLHKKDLARPATLVRKLRERKDALSRHIYESCSRELRSGIDRYQGKSRSVGSLIESLTKELSERLRTDNLFEVADKANLPLCAEVYARAQKNGAVPANINRLVLQSVYPDVLRPLQHGWFTIVFWDDGDSVVNTLRRSIESGASVRASNTPSELLRTFQLTIENPDATKRWTKNYSSDYEPNKLETDEVLLLAAMFPGVTSDPQGKGHVSHPETQGDEKRPGMGLHILLNTVIDVFGGSVSFRIDRLFLCIKKQPARVNVNGNATENIDYAAKVKRIGLKTVPFKGNMITIRVPSREE